MKPGRIVLAGGGGFLGPILARHFVSKGHEVINLSRTPRNNIAELREVKWDGCNLGEWSSELDGASAFSLIARLR